MNWWSEILTISNLNHSKPPEKAFAIWFGFFVSEMSFSKDLFFQDITLPTSWWNIIISGCILNQISITANHAVMNQGSLGCGHACTLLIISLCLKAACNLQCCSSDMPSAPEGGLWASQKLSTLTTLESFTYAARFSDLLNTVYFLGGKNLL